MKIIIHIDETPKWSMVINNLKHLNEVYTDPADQIELVVNGDAVTGVKSDSPDALALQQTLTNQNLLAVCQNSLNQRQISPSELIKEATIVPAGVVELVEKQSMGFNYLRP